MAELEAPVSGMFLFWAFVAQLHSVKVSYRLKLIFGYIASLSNISSFVIMVTLLLLLISRSLVSSIFFLMCLSLNQLSIFINLLDFRFWVQRYRCFSPLLTSSRRITPEEDVEQRLEVSRGPDWLTERNSLSSGFLDLMASLHFGCCG